MESFYPLMDPGQNTDDMLLDRYVAYRRNAGRPVTRSEFESIARYAVARGGYGDKVAANIMTQARRGGSGARSPRF